MRMGNLLSPEPLPRHVMATTETESATLAVDHPTVVPTNFEEAGETAEADGIAGTDETAETDRSDADETA
jgi:hypothetical protein